MVKIGDQEVCLPRIQWDPLGDFLETLIIFNLFRAEVGRSGRPVAGRVFSVQWFIVVEVGMGDIRLINTRKLEDIGAMELRKWLRKRTMVNMCVCPGTRLG